VEKQKDELIIGREEVVDMYIVLKGKVKISAYLPEDIQQVSQVGLGAV